jgi:ribonuclease Y
LEEIANSIRVFRKVTPFSGREVRIMVKPDDLDDLAATRLGADIARNIERRFSTWPDQGNCDPRDARRGLPK